MHAMANAFYWFAGMHADNLGQRYTGATGSGAKTADECTRIFADYIRATPEQVAHILAQSPRTEIELQAVIEEMGFPFQWEKEAKAAIAILEKWTGAKFESQATRGFWSFLDESTVAEIKARRASGYYSPEQVAARDLEARRARIEKKVAEIKKDATEKRAKITREEKILTHLVKNYGGELNCIYYNHSNELAFNWSSSEKLVTKEEFDAMRGKIEKALRLVCVFNAKPKY